MNEIHPEMCNELANSSFHLGRTQAEFQPPKIIPLEAAKSKSAEKRKRTFERLDNFDICIMSKSTSQHTESNLPKKKKGKRKKRKRKPTHNAASSPRIAARHFAQMLCECVICSIERKKNR